MAAAWAMKVPNPNLRPRLVAAVAIALAEQDGATAATLAVNGLDAGYEQDRTVVSIVQRWVQKTPQAAASWISQFPDIPLRDAAVQNLLALWSAQDTEAAGYWLREQSVSPLRDIGITVRGEVLADHDRTPVAGGTAGGM
jgi:hypothetical protein